MTTADFPITQLITAFIVVSITTSLVQWHVWWRIQRWEGREIGRANLWALLLTMRRLSMMKEVFRYISAKKYADVDSAWFRAECRVLKLLYIVNLTLLLAPLFLLFLPRG